MFVPSMTCMYILATEVVQSFRATATVLEVRHVDPSEYDYAPTTMPLSLSTFSEGLFLRATNLSMAPKDWRPSYHASFLL